MRADVIAAWKRTHSGEYAAYVIQRADGTVDAWIEQAGSTRNTVSALNSVPVAKVATDHMLFKDAGGHKCGIGCGEWETRITGRNRRDQDLDNGGRVCTFCADFAGGTL